MALKVNYPKAGEKAPEFCLKSNRKSRGTFECFDDFSGKFVVVYFYPKDDTPGCTIEAKEFSERLPKFDKLGVSVIGISPDSPEKHVDFCNKHFLKLDLLSDEDHSILGKYGAWDGRKVHRTTYLVAPDGSIAHVWREVKPLGHAEEVLQKVKEITLSKI